ncbi:MAG: N-acetylmuramoyl-L-alanine amidase [Methylococcales bacterium]|nr:N-acetylmuramoyl-L-alanine amidase [Methylococcales bacterium]
MSNFRCFFSVLILLVLSVSAQAKQIQVKSLRYWNSPDYSRAVFDVSSPVSHKIFLLQNPRRLVIDLEGAKLLTKLTQPTAAHPLFKKVRAATRGKNNLRIVLDLKGSAKPKSFTLKPASEYGHRLVVDLFAKRHTQLASKKATSRRVKKTPASKITQSAKKHTLSKVAAAPKKYKQAPVKKIDKARDIVVAIDAGHGGEDSGALGKHGTQEKKVVLQIAKKLESLINRKKGLRAVMIREGDYYVGLRKRMEIARQKKADVFISIHADSFKSAKVKGASVYTVSKRGASSEAARWLANKENLTDLVGGVRLDNKDGMVQKVLLGLSQKFSKTASHEVADNVLKQFKKIGHLHKDSVQHAGFMVLKSPDIPSILVETAFISNPSEEKKLKSGTHQRKMAKAIFKGVVNYFKENPLSNTYFAELKAKKKPLKVMRTVKNTQKSSRRQSAGKRHVIAKGETLSEIAVRYGVTMNSIKVANSLRRFMNLQIGQVLSIPRG